MKSVENSFGFEDPWHFGTDGDPDPHPALFVSDLQDANKNIIFLVFFAYYFMKVIKSHKKSQNSRNQGVSYTFCFKMEESGSGSGMVHKHTDPKQWTFGEGGNKSVQHELPLGFAFSLAK